MLNTTLNYLYAHAPLSIIAFSGAIGSSSVNLSGAGGQAGDGYPMPRHGCLTTLRVWDGTTIHSDSAEVPFQAGDRLSIYCQTTGSNFTVKARLNGSSTNLQVTGIPTNCTLYAVLEFALYRD
jgi:hypothetical protein